MRPAAPLTMNVGGAACRLRAMHYPEMLDPAPLHINGRAHPVVAHQQTQARSQEIQGHGIDLSHLQSSLADAPPLAGYALILQRERLRPHRTGG